MNEIQHLRNKLQQRFPAGEFGIDAPDNPVGHWWLDASLDGHEVVVEWRPGRGFGLATPTRDDYGVGPDEIYEVQNDAYERVSELLISRARTRSPETVLAP